METFINQNYIYEKILKNKIARFENTQTRLGLKPKSNELENSKVGDKFHIYNINI